MPGPFFPTVRLFFLGRRLGPGLGERCGHARGLPCAWLVCLYPALQSGQQGGLLVPGVAGFLRQGLVLHAHSSLQAAGLELAGAGMRGPGEGDSGVQESARDSSGGP